MSLGSKNHSNKTLRILKIKTKDKDGASVSPYFQVVSKHSGTWEVEDRQETVVSGKLTNLTIKTSEFQGEMYKTVQLLLEDDEEAYLLDLKFTLLTKGIFNSLLSLSDTPELEISLYQNKKGYGAAGVRVNGELLSWKYNLEDLPKPTSVMFKGKTMQDYSAVDDFYEQKLAELSTSLFGESTQPQTESKSSVAPKQEVKAKDETSGDDIPF